MFHVPAFSQYLDISDPDWKARACGPVCVGMILGYFGKSFPTLDELISAGISIGAHRPEVGWYHSGLVQLAQQYGITGQAYDWFNETPNSAFEKMLVQLKEGPIIASIHRQFDTSKGGHLIVVTSFLGNEIYYNEPDSETREHILRTIPKEDFLKGWKRRIIVLKEK